MRSACGASSIWEPGHTDSPLVIQDKRFDAMGNVVYDPSENEWFMGFLGDTILANLTVKPYLNVATRIYRFRLLNGSNSRIYRLAFVSPPRIQKETRQALVQDRCLIQTCRDPAAAVMRSAPSWMNW